MLVSDDNFGFFHKTKDQRQSKKLPATIGNGFMKNLAETHSAFPNIGKNLSQLSRANIARMLGITTALISGSTAVAINSRAPSEILLTPAGGEVLLLAETRMNTRDAAAAKRRSAEQDGREGDSLVREGQEGVLAATEAAAQKIANDVLGILRQKTDWSPEKRAAFVDWRINQWLEDSDIPKGSDRYNRWFNASKDKIEGNY